MYTVEFLSYFVFLSFSFVSSTVECSSVYAYATPVFRHDSSRPMLSHVEPRRRCECECVVTTGYQGGASKYVCMIGVIRGDVSVWCYSQSSGKHPMC